MPSGHIVKVARVDKYHLFVNCTRQSCSVGVVGYSDISGVIVSSCVASSQLVAVHDTHFIARHRHTARLQIAGLFAINPKTFRWCNAY